ncbi:MAG TPA: Coq4 family protein [Noviherbaspirillum sp.]|jgi:ubiquinone biosynthesis protein Coq4|nr:Coq4 family protein [Noviherbaspirillum sp.]
MQLTLLGKAFRAYRAGRIGDAAVYKSAALGASAYPEVERRLRALERFYPVIDLPALRRLKNGTFGHAYAQFIDGNKLQPLVVSTDTYADIAAHANPLAVRYLLLHDAFHVLLGFGISLPGELGVWSFVAGQHYSPSFDRAATYARLFYPVIAPSQIRELRAARLAGAAMARSAPCLIAQPIDAYWDEPLISVRKHLGIEVHNGANHPH